MNKQQLASKIWESANKMRSKIEANEYKDYILGFIFYKYLSDKELKFLRENDFSDADIKLLRSSDFTDEERSDLLKAGHTEKDIEGLERDNQESRNYIQENLGYFIGYKDLFSTWISKGRDFDASDVRYALSAFNRMIFISHKKVFENIFHTLETGLSKLGDTNQTQTKAISALIQLIKDIPMDGKQGYDVLGFIYEYLIGMFAANAGKKAGEFYTPHEVSLLMSEIVAAHLKGQAEIKIYDPTSGSGSLLINIGQSVAKYMNNRNNIQYFAQELKENTYNLTRMNLIMRDIKPSNIFTRNADTLEEDWPYFDENDPINSYNPLYVDAVVSNPPYSQAWDPSNKETDPRYNRFGLAPKTKADYAFLLHDLYHLKPNGIMTIVLPHGVLFRGGEEGEIRKNLIEKNHIDAIIGLPANIFFGTGIPTIVMVLKQRRDKDSIFIVDASKGFIKVGKNNVLRASDIKKITDALVQREEVPKFAKEVSRAEIRDNEYNLNIPRYVDSSDKEESWDIYASMFGGIPLAEVDEFQDFWNAFPTLKKDLFTESTSPYLNFATENIRTFIQEHAETKAFKESFENAFATFSSYLKNELLCDANNLDKMQKIPVAQEEKVISEDIFARLKNVALIDKYVAYQVLDDIWQNIAVDLEIIQTEGFNATKQVNPRMVIKKKDGKEEEVQDGFEGHVLPFELVQEHLLQDERSKLKTQAEIIASFPMHYDTLLQEMTEDELDMLSSGDEENQLVNEERDAFIFKPLPKKIKELRALVKEEADNALRVLLEKLLQLEKFVKEEKDAKKQYKKDEDALHLLTKNTIENLNDEKVLFLLEKKWIDTLLGNLSTLPDTRIKEFIGHMERLEEKYKNTFLDIEKEIATTQNELCTMLDELEGDDFDMQGLAEFKKLLGGM